METCLLFKREKTYNSLCTGHEYFSLNSTLLHTEQHSHLRLHNTQTHTQTNMHKPIVNSQVKAQILPLLKEIVQDEFADKVRVEGVVYDFCPAELEERSRPVIISGWHQHSPNYTLSDTRNIEINVQHY